MNDCLIVVAFLVSCTIYFWSAYLAVCYFSDTYKYISRLVFYIAILCPLWNCYFALKFLIPYLKTLHLREWLKHNFSFKE